MQTLLESSKDFHVTLIFYYASTGFFTIGISTNIKIERSMKQLNLLGEFTGISQIMEIDL